MTGDLSMLDWLEKGRKGSDGEDWITDIRLLAGRPDLSVYLGLAIVGAASDKAAHEPRFVSLGDAVEGCVVYSKPRWTALSVLDESRFGGRCLDTDQLIILKSGLDGIEVATPIQSGLGWGESER